MKKTFKIDIPKNSESLKETYFAQLNKATIKYKGLITNLIDSIYEINDTKLITDNHIDIFKEGLSQPNDAVFFDLAGKYLIRLLKYDNRIEKLLHDLSRDNSSRIRFNVITLMLYNPDNQIAEKILKAGLNDKSYKVREKAADVILRLEKKNLLDDLSNQLKKEIDSDKISKLSFYYNLLKDGYLIGKDEFGYNLTVKTKAGLTGRLINEKEYKNLKKTIRKIKNE